MTFHSPAFLNSPLYTKWLQDIPTLFHITAQHSVSAHERGCQEYVFEYFFYRCVSYSSLGTDTKRYHKATFYMFLNPKLKILIKIHNLKGVIRSTAYINNFLFANRKATSEREGCTAFKQNQLWYSPADCKYLP